MKDKKGATAPLSGSKRQAVGSASAKRSKMSAAAASSEMSGGASNPNRNPFARNTRTGLKRSKEKTNSASSDANPLKIRNPELDENDDDGGAGVGGADDGDEDMASCLDMLDQVSKRGRVGKQVVNSFSFNPSIVQLY